MLQDTAFMAEAIRDGKLSFSEAYSLFATGTADGGDAEPGCFPPHSGNGDVLPSLRLSPFLNRIAIKFSCQH